jgi:hypothetical protein
MPSDKLVYKTEVTKNTLNLTVDIGLKIKANEGHLLQIDIWDHDFVRR